MWLLHNVDIDAQKDSDGYHPGLKQPHVENTQPQP